MSYPAKFSAPGCRLASSQMIALVGSVFFLLCIAGCASSKQPDFGGLMAQLAPARWQQPGVWDFQIVDPQKKSMGRIRLDFTGERIATACDDHDWMRAIIIENEINYDFGFELQAAYRVHGHWLTVDLTASVCGADHLLIGELEDDGASGFFNYSHRLGGNNVGTFSAVPADHDAVP